MSAVDLVEIRGAALIDLFLRLVKVKSVVLVSSTLLDEWNLLRNRNGVTVCVGE